MAYEAKTWIFGEIITPEDMNRLEQGVKNEQIGPQGPAGKSAYQYAVEGGYPGTEQEFMEKLATTPGAGEILLPDGSSVIDALANKAALSAQQTVEKATITGRGVNLAASELQAYIDALPRLVAENLSLNVTGEWNDAVELKNFYGPGKITIYGGGGFTLRNQLIITNCSVFVYAHSAEFQERAGMVAGTGLLSASQSGYVRAHNCGFTGLGAGSKASGIEVLEGTSVLVDSARISNCQYAVLAGMASVLSVESGEFSGNANGAYVWNGGIVLLGNSIPNTLGGTANQKKGGIIAKADGTLI